MSRQRITLKMVDAMEKRVKPLRRDYKKLHAKCAAIDRELAKLFGWPKKTSRHTARRKVGA
jgi:hypothetical protein